MNNLLGVEYFRLVKERGGADWSQVYVKIPLDRKGVRLQGGIFGVMRLADGEDSLQRGSVLMGLLEQEYKDVKEDVLKSVFKRALRKESSLEVCLVQVLEDGGGKKIVRVVVNSSGFVDIVRNGKRVRLISSVVGANAGSVLKGELLKGDRLVLGVGKALEFVEENNEVLVRDNLSVVGEDLSSILFSKNWEESFGVLLVDVVEEKKDEEESVDVVLPGLWQRRKNFFSVNIRPRNDVRRKWPLWIASVFFVVLAVSVVIGLKKSKINSERLKFDTLVESIEKKRKDGLDLLVLNPAGARDLITKAKMEAETADKNVIGPYENEWKKEIENLSFAWEKVSGESSFKEDVFFDLELIRGDLKGDLVIYEKGKVFVLDKEKKIVVGLGIDDKKNEVISGNASDAWKGMVVVGGKILGVENNLIVNDRGEAVYEFESVIGGVSSAASFGSYVYILDDVNGEIWKLKVVDSTEVIGARTRWLTEDVSALKGGLDIGIDGDVWVAGKTSVIRLRRGSRESFELKNAPAGMEIVKIAVWPEPLESDGYIVVLDKLHGKVLVFNRSDGEYVKQWSFEDFKKASDLEFISKNEVLVLIEGKLYKISI